MKNLFMWEYKEETWIGFERDDGSLGGVSDGNWMGMVRARVTNLRPVKVVDADAVVIGLDEIDLSFIKKDINFRVWNQSRMAKNVFDQIKTQFPTVETLTEPKNFGAIVEAECPCLRHHGDRHKFIKSQINDEAWWHSNRGCEYPWKSLTNPTIISKGIAE